MFTRGLHPSMQWVGVYIPWADTPLQADTPQAGNWSGRYASYWNTFLLGEISYTGLVVYMKLEKAKPISYDEYYKTWVIYDFVLQRNLWCYLGQGHCVADCWAEETENSVM